MAGSGKGRGRAAFTFNIEAIGFAKGETLPEAVFKPTPLFPPTGFKPVPLKMGEDEDYMLALKQEFRGSMKKMPYFIANKDENQAIEKYSKKYLQMRKESMEWIPDWRRLPREMKPRKKTKKVEKTKKAKVDTTKSNVDVLKKIENMLRSITCDRSWKRKAMEKKSLMRKRRKKKTKRVKKKQQMNKKNMMKRNMKRKMTTLLHILKMEMILVLVVTTTWMKQPISYLY
ncbi:DNA-directed RNA polymerase III subunit RPC7 isoform X2 [Emydura macquarii macquarii]|uniref:DNA-directed RNA polymerase III subunit RPC7 isoform X2 n=1 Tax=Emydura macquarii macquarii TaxID=1129001 RepID=UPI00352A8ECF